MEKIKTKYCNKCGEVKPISEYGKDKHRKDGLNAYCKLCRTEQVKEHYKDSEGYRERTKTYRQRRVERDKEYQEEYRKKERERYKKRREYLLSYHALRRATDPEFVDATRENARRYSKSPQGKHTAKIRSYKKRVPYELRGTFSLGQWEALGIRQDGKCAHCGKKRTLEVDHIIPLSKGGTNDIHNIQGLCRSCNSAKGNKAYG